MTAVDVDALAKLREAATAGPWTTDVTGGSAEAPFVRAVGTWDGFDQVHVGGFTGFRGSENAALIVAMHNALPELLAEVRRGRALREVVEGLAEDHERWARVNAHLSGEDTDGPDLHDGMRRAQEATAKHLRAVVAAVDGGEH